jgi:hypothetical protein
MAAEPALRWSAYEHEHVERGADWFWALGIVAVSIAATAILLHDAFFGVLVIVAAFTLALLARTPPSLAEFELSERGIRVNGALHRFDHVISFWVEEEHAAKPLLLVDTTKFLSPNLIIPIEEVDPSLVRAFLKQHAKEKHMKEPVAHKILEFLGL